MDTKKVKLAQFLWTGLKGTKLTPEEIDFLTNTPVGGVILFTRNYESPEQVYKLNKHIQDISISNGLKVPAVIGVDMEGGRVARFKDPFTIWPPMNKLGEKQSPTLAYDFGVAMGTELRAVGVNFDFSPCTDTILNDENDVIGDRAFSNDPEEVGKVASGVIRGFKKVDMLSCIKHFPGHGYTKADSHDELPIDDRKLEDIIDIDAFRRALRSKPEFLMPGHLMFPNVDPDYPVTLSEKWIKDILIDDMGTRAFIMTDDLEMGALQKYELDYLVERTYNIGFDQLLFCHGHEKAKEALEILNEKVELDIERFDRIMDFKESTNLLGPESFDSSKIGAQDHKDLAKKIAE